MSVDSIFTVLDKKYNSETNTINVHIKMDKENDVFKGHFPQQPILPGVCQLHLVRSILEDHYSKVLVLKNSSNIKFLKMIDPIQSDEFELSIKVISDEEAHLKVNANINNLNGVCLKFKGSYLSE